MSTDQQSSMRVLSPSSSSSSLFTSSYKELINDVEMVQGSNANDTTDLIEKNTRSSIWSNLNEIEENLDKTVKSKRGLI